MEENKVMVRCEDCKHVEPASGVVGKPCENCGGDLKPMYSTGKRGFGSMDPAKQREIASKGGKAAHAKGTAHEWTKETARAAGRKGGTISRGGRGRLTPFPKMENSLADPPSNKE